MKETIRFSEIGLYTTFYHKDTEYFKVTEDTAVGPNGQVMIFEPELEVKE